MPEEIYLALAALSSWLGMVWFALAMDVHWAQARGIALAESRPPQVVLRVLGFMALLLALGLCLMADRPSIAVLVWLMLMTGAAVLVAFALANKPHLLKAVWPR